MKYWLLVFLIAANCQLALASDAFVWEKECDKNQLSMNQCAGEKFKFYDKILNDLYRRQMSHLSQEKNKQYLRESQRAWIKFRDLDCTYKSGKREDSGSIWPLEHFSCLADRTQTRIIELKEYIACRQNGCPW